MPTARAKRASDGIRYSMRRVKESAEALTRSLENSDAIPVQVEDEDSLVTSIANVLASRQG